MGTSQTAYKRIGITGQGGFLGTHIFNMLNLYPDKFKIIPFDNAYFNNMNILIDFVSQCDVIIHLAAINRHNDSDFMYRANIELVEKLINALEMSKNCPHIIFSSSVQENFDNLYGKSKKMGRKMFISWAKNNNAIFTGLILPNLFGPFGKPKYNSFIATFCYQLTHNEVPIIDVDKMVSLVYVNDVVKTIIDCISNKTNCEEYCLENIIEKKVSEILATLKSFKLTYVDSGIIPKLNNQFDHNLFNTFRSHIDINVSSHKLISNIDDRGLFVELIKTNIGGQFSFSTTKPGVTRGNHFHVRKIERFIVIKGSARIMLRKIGTNEELNFYLSENEPSYIDIPIWHVHNITNIGDDALYTLFWTNEFYDPIDSDTYYEKYNNITI